MTKSMTAFVRLQGEGEFRPFVWEIRSVNHRYLDMSFKISEQFREIESSLREIVSEYVKRGKIDCSLRYQQDTMLTDIFQINEPALKQMQTALQRIQQTFMEPVAL